MAKDNKGYLVDRFYKRFSEKAKESHKRYSKKDRRANKVKYEEC